MGVWSFDIFEILAAPLLNVQYRHYLCFFGSKSSNIHHASCVVPYPYKFKTQSYLVIVFKLKPITIVLNTLCLLKSLTVLSPKGNNVVEIFRIIVGQSILFVGDLFCFVNIWKPHLVYEDLSKSVLSWFELENLARQSTLWDSIKKQIKENSGGPVRARRKSFGDDCWGGKRGNLGGRGALDRCTASTRRKQTSFSTISPAPSPLHHNILSLSLLHHLSLVVCYDASLWHCYDFDVGNVGFLKL